jgi:hypothetical protein
MEPTTSRGGTCRGSAAACRVAPREEFLGVREVVDGLGIPVIDLIDTFERVDYATYRVADHEGHPNAAGHRLLFERLYERLGADARLSRAFAGDRH